MLICELIFDRMLNMLLMILKSVG